MTEQNRKYIKKVIGKLLSEILRIKGPSEQEYGQKNPVIKKLSNGCRYPGISAIEIWQLIGTEKSIIESRRVNTDPQRPLEEPITEVMA